jgi:hypothetical protein
MDTYDHLDQHVKPPKVTRPMILHLCAQEKWTPLSSVTVLPVCEDERVTVTRTKKMEKNRTPSRNSLSRE